MKHVADTEEPDAIRKRPFETSEKLERSVTFLPNTPNLRQELLSLLIAVPVSLLGTSFMFYLLNLGQRLAS